MTTPEEELAKLARLNIGYLSIFDNDYPLLLKETHDAPVILYMKGSPEALKSACLAVVGSRKYSSYGRKFSYKISKECALNGLTIVSGLALGIDSFAHQAAIDAGAKTVGVLGCGLDQIYPSSNRELAHEMINNGGALVSEFPPGTPPLKQNFPARNRIIAGLSLGVLVIEAAAQSGALITAYQALENNREIFALPGNIDLETSEGTNNLIKEGAALVTGSEEILAGLNIEKRVAIDIRENFPENSDERLICKFLQGGPKTVDQLIEETGLSIISINSALSILEMKKIIANVGAGRYGIEAKR